MESESHVSGDSTVPPSLPQDNQGQEDTAANDAVM